MAKNWTVAEVATIIRENGVINENVLDYGKRFPVAANLIASALSGDIGAVALVLMVLPEYVTMGKLDKILKTSIEEGTPLAPEIEDDEDKEEIEEKPVNKKTAAATKKTTVKEEAADEDDLESRTGKELLEIGKELGIPASKMKGKAMAIESIRAKRAEQEDSDEEEHEDEEMTNYSKLPARDLYKLCKDRGIKVEQKKPVGYYIEKLDEADEAAEESDDEEEETTGYSEMPVKDLYALCKERGIKAIQRKPAKYYIELLEKDDEEADGSDDEWEEEEEEKPAAKTTKRKPAANKKEDEEWDI